MGTFYGVTAEVTLPATTGAQGAVDVRSSPFRHLLNGLLSGLAQADNDRVELSVQPDKLFLTTGRSVAWIFSSVRLNTEAEQLDEAPHPLPVQGVEESFRRTLYAVGTNGKLHPAFRALHLSQAANIFTATGSDGNVLACFTVCCADARESPLSRIGLPRESAELLLRMFRHHRNESVDLRVCPTYCSWTFSDGSRLTSRSVTDKAPDFSAATPQRDNFLQIQHKTFQQAIGMFGRADNPSILVSAQKSRGELSLTGTHHTEAQLSTVVPIAGNPAQWKGKFSARYLSDICEHGFGEGTGVIDISMGSRLQEPLVFRSSGYVVVLMPQESKPSDYRA